MTFGWAGPSMVLLRSRGNEVQCPCSGVLEMLSSKTPSGNMPVVFEGPAIFLKGMWGYDFSCCHLQEKVLAL